MSVLRSLLNAVFSWYLHLFLMCVNIYHTSKDKKVWMIHGIPVAANNKKALSAAKQTRC